MNFVNTRRWTATLLVGIASLTSTVAAQQPDTVTMRTCQSDYWRFTTEFFTWTGYAPLGSVTYVFFFDIGQMSPASVIGDYRFTSRAATVSTNGKGGLTNARVSASCFRNFYFNPSTQVGTWVNEEIYGDAQGTVAPLYFGDDEVEGCTLLYSDGGDPCADGGGSSGGGPGGNSGSYELEICRYNIAYDDDGNVVDIQLVACWTETHYY